MSNCLIYDYETLGQDPNSAPLLSIALYAFDDQTIGELTLQDIVSNCSMYKFDVAEQITKYNKVVDPSTVEWWSKQSKDAQAVLEPSDDDVSIVELPNMFQRMSNVPFERVYTRGNTFDPIFTTRICKDINVDEPYPWWAIRDTRSLIEGMSYGSSIRNTFMPPSVNKADVVLHDPRYDIALDVLRIASLT
jgi:hypothetical protein